MSKIPKRKKKVYGHCELCKKNFDSSKIYKGVCEGCLDGILDTWEDMYHKSAYGDKLKRVV